MIVFYLSVAALAFVTYFLTSRLNSTVRIAISILVFLIPALLLTGWLYHVGDSALPDSLIVDPTK